MSRTAALRVALAVAALAAVATVVRADPEEDRATVAALDTEYQAAVKANDADAMERILHPEFALVSSSGKVYDRKELLRAARDGDVLYERQDEVAGSQKVRVYGDTAVVTARLRISGKPKSAGKDFDYELWFSDTYVRTPDGWRYAFGQAGQHLVPAS
jgi:ketosteroid isomerase-like protein